MPRVNRKPLLSIGTLILITISIFFRSAYAVPQLSIVNVAVVVEDETLFIYGSSFDNGDPPTVTLAGYPMTVSNDAETS